MLATLILACIAAGIVTAVAMRAGRLPVAAGVLAVTVLPLGALLLMQYSAEPARSPMQFEVLGQWHRIGHEIRFAADTAADFRLRDTQADVRVRFDAAAGLLALRVVDAVEPVIIGGMPVNAVRLRRNSMLTAGSDSVSVTRPWLCLKCDTRFISENGVVREVRLSALPRIAVGTDTVRLFRGAGATWVAGRPGTALRADGAALPDTATARADTLSFGAGSAERVYVAAVPMHGRIDVSFDERARARWVLPRTDADSITLIVSATAGEPLPGTLPVLNPGAAAPGAAAVPYGGALRQRGGDWEYIADGASTRFDTDTPQLLPRASQQRSSGHIVQLRRYDMDPGRARWAAISAWLLGALALAWLWRHLNHEAASARIALLAPIYALIAVRGTLAFRVWLAPPHDANSPQTFLALLLAVPALIAVLHLWQRAVEAGAVRTLRREIALTAAPLVLASVTVVALVIPSWRVPVLTTALAAVLLGAGGLALLNHLLLGRSRTRRDPLAAATAPALEGYSHREFVAALVLLATLGFLLIVLMQLLRYGTLVALAGWGLILAATLFTLSDPDVVIRRRSRARPVVAALATGAAAAAIALLLGLGIVITLAALAVGAAVAWLAADNASFNVRPVRVRSLLVAPLLIAAAASLGAVLLPGIVGALRVTAEYALALAGLVAIVRIFSILWFRHTQRLSRSRSRARRPLPGMLSIGGVMVLLIAAVYVPLALIDQGVVLLFLAATVAAMAVGFHAMGARALAALVPVSLVAVFVGAMFITPSRLQNGSASLSTAQIRYAATYHPRELERHMLAADDARPVTTVRTLQQYWGISHYAAGGTTGRGYFGGGYADWIVPRPVALTENVFSTFVLAEHGWFGALALLLCYLAIALALLRGAVTATDRTGTAPRALLLVGLAAFWLVPALYIAGANGLVLPLTGQNMPMLGLLSRADVALACWLAAIGLCAMPTTGSSGIEHAPSAGWAARLRTGSWMTGGVFATATIALIVLLWRPTHADVGDFSLSGVAEDVETLVAQGAIQIMPVGDGRDTLGVAAAAAAHPLLADRGFLRNRIARANSIARGEGGGAGCLDSDALLRPRDDGGIAVFSALCSIRSAPRAVHPWTGALATASTQPGFVFSDGRSAIVLDADAPAGASFGPCAARGVQRARAIRIGCDAQSPVIRFGTSAPVLETSDTTLQLNGIAAAVPTLIRHGDHLRTGGVDVWAHQLPAGAIGYARWENAAQRRIVHASGAAWVAQVDSQLARGMAHADRAQTRAELTLHGRLHAHLNERLGEICATIPGVRRCSAVIADPLTGAVLATAATAAQPHRFLPSDPNLRNHPAASAVKPILAAAALHAYPQLRTLEVDHADAEYTVVANTGVQPSLRAPRLYPSARIPLRGYLGASDNLYSATLGFIATSARGAEGAPALRGQRDHSRLVMNGRPLRGEPSWSGNGELDLSASPLAEALNAIYGVHVTSRSVPPFERSFWEPAVAAGALVPGADLQRITPEPVGLRMDSFRSPRELTSFSIGGDRNRWNNVALVEAMSRIYTGRAVRLHLLSRVGEQQLAYPAPEIASFAARQDVLDGMAAVTQEPWGTAWALRSAFAPRTEWRAKTGTLREREWVGSVFLFAGGGTDAAVCSAAGVVTVEFSGDANPDGAATIAFRDAVAPLLRSLMGWGTAPCATAQ